MRKETEWDWPPPRRRRRDLADLDGDGPPVFDAHIVGDQIRLKPQRPYQRTGWSGKRAIDMYGRALVGVVKFVVAIPLAIMTCLALWLLLALLKLA
jgi:hypothetical protein